MYAPVIVKELIQIGANVKLSTGYAPVSLKEFAQLAVRHNVHLTIDCSGIAPVIAKELANIGKSNITLIS